MILYPSDKPRGRDHAPLAAHRVGGGYQQWIKEGKHALNCPDRSGLPQFRGQPGEVGSIHPFGKLRTGLAYNCIVSLPNLLGNFMRRLCLPAMGHYFNTLPGWP